MKEACPPPQVQLRPSGKSPAMQKGLWQLHEQGRALRPFGAGFSLLIPEHVRALL